MHRNTLRFAAAFIGLLFGILGLTFAGETNVGVHGGISIPDLRAKETDIFSRGFSSRQGVYFGLSTDVGLAPGVSLAMQLNYTSQGGLRKGLQPITMDLPQGLPIPPGTILYADFRNDTVLDYIEVPAMARLSFGRRVRVFIEAGAYFGYLAKARALTEGTSALYLDEAGTQPVIIPPDTEPLVIDLGDNTNVRASLKRTNVGLAGGGGLVYPLGPGALVLEARFQLGLTTIQKDIETSGETQTGAVVISLGYQMRLAKHR
jgi:hypothetical protein